MARPPLSGVPTTVSRSKSASRNRSSITSGRFAMRAAVHARVAFFRRQGRMPRYPLRRQAVIGDLLLQATRDLSWGPVLCQPIADGLVD